MFFFLRGSLESCAREGFVAQEDRRNKRAEGEKLLTLNPLPWQL